MALIEEGQKVLILRYGKKKDCIDKHLEVIKENGYCWFGKIGVIIFVLITGYFYSKQRFSVKKIFQLSTIARWYTIPALVISFLFIEKGLHMSLQDIVKAIFLISFSEYWFLTSFVVILILQPILQPFLVSANRIQKLKMTGLVILLCHIPSFIGLVSQTDNYFSLV